MAGYRHTQRGPFHLVVLGVAALIAYLSIVIEGEGAWVRVVLLVVAALMVVLAAGFAQLTVSEESDHLRIAFGPLPLARRRVPFADVRAAKVARSLLIDGWGVHWIPGRGWTWNIWGFDCVELELEGGRGLRIGTDDAERLAEVIRARAGL